VNRPVARLLSVVPPGTHLVIGGTLTLGAASYIQIAAANHALSGDPRAAVSALWSLIMTLSLGLFFPVEQELTRVVASRAVRGQGVLPVLRRAIAGTLLMIGAIALLLALTAGPTARLFLHGQKSLLWTFAAAVLGMGLAYASRGVLAGLGRFNAYGVSLAIDGGLRIVLAPALLLCGVHSAWAFALVLAIAPLGAVVCTLPATLRGCGPGPQMAWSELFQNTGLLVGASLLAQVMVNAAVLTVGLVAPDNADLQVAVLNAGVLCRVPLFVLGSILPTLMTGLSTAAAEGDRSGFRRLLVRTSGVVGGLGLLGGVPAVLFGPWLLKSLLGAPDVLGHWDLFWFSAGTMFYMLAMVVGQALIAMDRHRFQLAGWALGTAVLVGVSCVHSAVAVRVEVSYFLGSATTALFMLAFVWWSPGRRTLSTAVDRGAESGESGAARQQRLSTDMF
jgi:O-antigen/teichoic acid export membrane protein